MRRAAGIQSEADYLLNCNVFDYYQRLVIGHRYSEYMTEQYDKNKKK